MKLPRAKHGVRWQPKSKRPKCATAHCRNAAYRGRCLCHKCRQRKWRQNQPISDAWENHKHHAKERGIPVQWNREEFRLFCLLTGYHLTRKDGMTIERKNPLAGYNLLNCETLTRSENSSKGARFDRWIKQKISGMLRQDEKKDRVA